MISPPRSTRRIRDKTNSGDRYAATTKKQDPGALALCGAWYGERGRLAEVLDRLRRAGCPPMQEGATRFAASCPRCGDWLAIWSLPDDTLDLTCSSRCWPFQILDRISMIAVGHEATPPVPGERHPCDVHPAEVALVEAKARIAQLEAELRGVAA